VLKAATATLFSGHLSSILLTGKPGGGDLEAADWVVVGLVEGWEEDSVGEGLEAVDWVVGLEAA
jgi:hypothetical protein